MDGPRRKLTDEARRETARLAGDGDLEAARKLVRDLERERGREPEGDFYRAIAGRAWSALREATEVIKVLGDWGGKRHPSDAMRTLDLIERHAKLWAGILDPRLAETRKLLSEGPGGAPAGDGAPRAPVPGRSVFECLDKDLRPIPGTWLAQSVAQVQAMAEDRADQLKSRDEWFDEQSRLARERAEQARLELEQDERGTGS